ncbi:FecR family protein [Thalassospiraceae bacterium LMO-SO8]|nr:FecR family protein [Alphaproteobacteria bacterium LMO-S08]WND76135.1 FecR family protein [Thalassospiraceae bacterium LMO-SO8]
MRRTMAMGLLAALFLMIADPAAQAAEGDVAGKVLRLKNDAVALQGAVPRPLKVGSEVRVSDVISTGDGARLEFSLRDGSVVTLGERATFALSDFEDAPSKESIALRLLSGAFKAASGSIAARNPDAMTVATNTATIGIRGTTVWGGTLDTAFEVALLDGTAITVTTRAGTVELNSVGQGTSVPSADQPPAAPVTWAQTKVTRALATVDF